MFSEPHDAMSTMTGTAVDEGGWIPGGATNVSLPHSMQTDSGAKSASYLYR
jgi:hypothetical protein